MLQDTSRFRIELSYLTQDSDGLFRGADRQPNPARLDTSFQNEVLHLGWKVTDKLEIALSLPYIEIRSNTVGHVRLDGLGDIALLADWGPWRPPSSATQQGRLLEIEGLSLLVGLKFPTGEPSDHVIAAGNTPPSLLQLGTGTWDPVIGVRYRGATGAFALHHASTVVISGGSSEAGLAPANVFQTTTGVGYELFHRVTPGVDAEGVFRGKDALRGDTIANTGSTAWFVMPNLSVRILDVLRLEGSVRIPIYCNVDRTQLVPGDAWSVSLTWSF